jgi:uncharacterized protein
MEIETKTDRLEKLRAAIDAIVHQQPDLEEKRCGFAHLYGVSAVCVLLAQRRGLDLQLAAAAGMLHDIWSYQTGDPTDHARHSASAARGLLGEQGEWTAAEIDAICDAIAHHSQKSEQHGPLAELLKDADALQHYLYNPALSAKRSDRQVLTLRELGIDNTGV